GARAHGVQPLNRCLTLPGHHRARARRIVGISPLPASAAGPSRPALAAPLLSYPPTPRAPLSPGRLRLVILAMSLGAFAIGTTECASMCLLPQIADDLGVSIPRAGMLITLYALGVVIGAPLVTIAAVRIPRARLLVLLVGL